MICRPSDIHWFLSLQTMIDLSNAKVECYRYSDARTLQLRIHPTDLKRSLSGLIRRSLKKSLPLGYVLNVIVPPVKRTDVAMMKGSTAYRHPYYSVEITCPEQSSHGAGSPEPAHC